MTCLVTFSAATSGGAMRPNAKLVFVDAGPEIRAAGATVVPRDVIEAFADSAGNGSVTLRPGRYVLRMVTRLGEQSAPITVPAETTVDLWTLLDSTPAPLPPESILMAQEFAQQAQFWSGEAQAFASSRIRPQSYGAQADLSFVEQQIRDQTGALIDAYGFVRTGGTNDRDAIIAADAAAAALGVPLWFDGDFYVEGEIRPTTLWLSDHDFGATIWLNYANDSNGRSTSGIVMRASNTGLGIEGNHGFRLIGQFSRPTAKELRNGQLGTIWRIADYYTTTEQPILENMHIRVKCVRAAEQRDVSGAIIQRSLPSYHGAAMAGMERCGFEIGVFGRTNVTADGPIQVHWGCRYDPASIAIAGATLTAGGSDYATAPTVTVLGGGAGVTRTATVTATVLDGVVTGLTFQDLGAGYTERPTLSFSGGGGSGAAATVLFGDAEATDKTPATIIEAYRAIDFYLRYTTVLDNRNGHGFITPYVLSSVGYPTVYTPDAIGIGHNALGTITVGDIAGHYTVPSQAGKVMKGIRIFCGTATEVDGILGTEQLAITGRGTAAATADVEPGTSLRIERQVRMEVEVHDASVVFASAATPGNQRAVFLNSVYGSVKLINTRSEGGAKAIEIENSWGDFEVDGVAGDGAVLVNFSGACKLNGLRMDRRNIENAGDTSPYAFGWGSPNSRAIEVTGQTVSLGVTSADIALGAVIIPLATPLATRVFTDQPIKVGTQTVRATRMHRIGSLTLSVTPLNAAVITGATVQSVQRSQVRELQPATSSSYYAIEVNDSDVSGVDLSGMAYAGFAAVRGRGDSRVTLVDGKLPSIGRAGGDPRTLVIEDTGSLTLDRVYIPATDLTTHIRRVDTATVTVANCTIEDPTNVITNTLPLPAYVSWKNNRLLNGEPAAYLGHESFFEPTLLVNGSAIGITYTSSREGLFRFLDNDLVYLAFDFVIQSLGGAVGDLTFDTSVIPYPQDGPNAEAITIDPCNLGVGTPVLRVIDNLWTFQRQTPSGLLTLNESNIGPGSRFNASFTYSRA